MSKKVYVGNLAFSVTEADLKELFSGKSYPKLLPEKESFLSQISEFKDADIFPYLFFKLVIA